MVGVDRYIAVTRPFSYSSLVTKAKFYRILICLWVAAITTFTIPVFTKRSLSYYVYNESTNMCGMYWEYRSFCIITGLYIPILSGGILAYTSIRISRTLKEQRKQQRNQAARRDARSASTRKTFKILLAASAAYFFCWGPYTILVFARSFSVISLPAWLYFSITWLANSNSMMNVIIYSLTNQAFRETLQSLLLSRKINRITLIMETTAVNTSPEANRSSSRESNGTIKLHALSTPLPRRGEEDSAIHDV